MKSDQNVENGLPKGWVECSIGQVTLPVSKIDPKEEPGREIDYIDIASIDNTRQVIGQVKRYQLKDAPSRARQIVRSGDVLFATVRPYLRNIASVPNDYDQQIASTGFSVLRPAGDICPDFLFYKAISRDFVNALTGAQYGVSYPAVKDEQVREQPLWLPPLSEQHRIVAKIEELFSELDKGVESLKTAQAQLKVYRQAVLKHAFEGKLTAQWREENKGKLETPEQLLARIKQEREVRYEQQLQEWKAAVKEWEGEGRNGKKPPKPRKPITPDKPRSDQLDRMWAVPPTWQWLQVGNFAFVTKLAGFEYTKFVEYDDDGDLPVIKAENAGPNGFRATRYSRVKSKSVQHLTRSYLEGSELLMVFVGAGTGNVATVPKDQAYFLGPNIGMIRPETQAIKTRYVELFLRSPIGKQLALASVKAVTQPSLSMGTIRQIPIILPSTEEQSEIVQQLDNILSAIDAIEAEIDGQLLKADALRQSVLKKAFSGQLVPQDPNDEPASVLLDRIRAEREKAVKNNHSKKTKKRRTRA